MKITQSALKYLIYQKSNNKADLRFDDDLKGFGVRIYPSGRKSFFISYRNAQGVKKRHTLGDFGLLTAKSARDFARDKLAEVRKGGDPALERDRKRQELTFGELADRYIEYATDFKKSIRDDRQRLRDHIEVAREI